jgi:hypothetical protein
MRECHERNPTEQQQLREINQSCGRSGVTAETNREMMKN